MRRRAAAALVLVAVVLALATRGATAQTPRVLHVLGWADYIAPSVLAAFTRETGVGIVYDTFDSYDQAAARLQTNPTGWDVAMASPAMVARGVADKTLAPLDRSALPNWKNLDPFLLSRLALFDPGNRSAIDYAWFTSGVAFNVAQAQKRLGGKPIDGWDAIFRPENLRRFADCGVDIVDDPDDVLSAALRWLGLDPNSKNPVDLRRAAETIARLKSSVRKFSSTDYADGLADGDVCLALGRTGESVQARRRARAGDGGIEIGFVVPKEGARLSMDALVVPAGAPQPERAAAFLDFLMRPDIAAQNADATGFASGDAAARALIDKSIAQDPAIYPDESVMRRLYVVTPAAPAAAKIVAREWQRAKTGK